MRPVDPHIAQENAELRQRVSVYQDQIADTNERLCAKEDELERERLLREELVNKAIAERMERIFAEAYEKAKADAYAEVQASVAERESRVTQLEMEVSQKEEEARRERDALVSERSEMETERAAMKAERDRAEECLRQSREKLAAEVRDLKANTKKIKEEAIRDYIERCGQAKDELFNTFLNSLSELPGATPKRRKEIAQEYTQVADKAISAVGEEAKRQIQAAVAKSKENINHIGWLANQVFGRRSERIVFSEEEWSEKEKEWGEGKLLDEEERKCLQLALKEHRQALAILRARDQRKSSAGHGQSPIPDSVPVSSVTTLIPDVVKENPGKYRRIGVTEQRQLRRHVSFTQDIVHKETYALIAPLENPDLPEIVSVELPEELKDRGKYHNSVKAWTTVSKYVDHLPLARQEDITEREGCRINRSQLSDMVDECHSFLEALFPLLEAEVLASECIAADGTPMRVVDNDRHRTVQRYVTSIRSIDTGAVIFKSYVNTEEEKRHGKQKAGRSAEVLKSYFVKWKGNAIMCDAFQGYDWMKITGKILCRCSSHGRREFFKADKENQALAREPLMLFQMIFLFEEYIADELKRGSMTLAEVCPYRKTFEEPLWIQLKAYCAQTILAAPAGSQIRKACNYLLRHYDEMTNYLDIPVMPCHNNETENVLRKLVLGKKNYLFSQTEESLARDTVIYSFFATCAVNHIDPIRWLEYVMDNLHSTPADKLHTLLPQHWVDPSKI